MVPIPVTKEINLRQLQDELVAAGVNVPAVGMSNAGLFTYDGDGNVIDLPQAAEAIIEAHTALPSEPEAAKADIVSQYAAAVTRLDEIVADGPTYTAAQTRDAVVDLARIQRRLLRFVKAALT